MSDKNKLNLEFKKENEMRTVILAVAEEIVGKETPCKTDLNINPSGVTYRGGVLAVCSYFQPAILRGPVTKDQNGDVEWNPISIDDAEGTMRLMPEDIPYGRAQTVNLMPDGTMWMTWNSGRIIRVFEPPKDEGGRWSLQRDIALPQTGSAMVHSLGIATNYHGNITVATIESGNDFDKPWLLCFYDFVSIESNLRLFRTQPIPAWRYGICRHNDQWWTVTDHRSKETSGIYALNDLGRERQVIDDVYGNGIAFLDDGSAVVTQHSENLTRPGAIVFIPANAFANK